MRRQRYERLAALAQKLAPPGRWLDIGCGTGTLLSVAEENGVTIDGMSGRPRGASVARQTSARIYEQPLEVLRLRRILHGDLHGERVSHLVSPSATFAEIQRMLVANGIVVVWTSEIGPGVEPHHMWDWGLGDHLQFLGDGTIERYADRFGFELVKRERAWLPDVQYSRDRLAAPGTSRARDAIKRLVLAVPGSLQLFRAIMMSRQRDNPGYVSLLALQRR